MMPARSGRLAGLSVAVTYRAFLRRFLPAFFPTARVFARVAFFAALVFAALGFSTLAAASAGFLVPAASLAATGFLRSRGSVTSEAVVALLSSETFGGALSGCADGGLFCSTGLRAASTGPAGSTLTPSAFHSRRAIASRGETSGYSLSSPTVGKIFHDRAHLVPTACSTTTATPLTSGRVNAPAGGSSLLTIAFEVMQTSARSTSNSVAKIALSET